jgi:hypothetical protein
MAAAPTGRPDFPAVDAKPGGANFTAGACRIDGAGSPMIVLTTIIATAAVRSR